MVNKNFGIFMKGIPVLVFFLVVMNYKSIATDIFYLNPMIIQKQRFIIESTSIRSASLEFLLPQKKTPLSLEYGLESSSHIEYLSRINLPIPFSAPLSLYDIPRNNGPPEYSLTGSGTHKQTIKLFQTDSFLPNTFSFPLHKSIKFKIVPDASIWESLSHNPHAGFCPAPEVVLASSDKNPFVYDTRAGTGYRFTATDTRRAGLNIAFGRAPELICPGDISTYTDINSCSAFMAGELDPWYDEEEVVNLTWEMEGRMMDASPVRGIHLIGDYTFEEGATIITYTATGKDGTTSACTFTITISDNQVPRLLGMPGNITVAAAPGLCSARVNWSMPTASDNCTSPFQIRIVGSHRPGDDFPVGTTRVNYRAIDAMGNESQPQSFTVTVEDRQPPVLAMPAGGSIDCGQPVPEPWATVQQFTTAGGSATDNCSVNETTFRLRTQTTSSARCPYTITRVYEIRDAAGNTGTAEHKIYVTGKGEAPVVQEAKTETEEPVVLKSGMAGLIKAIATGDWNSASTWDCNCIPTATDDVEIPSGFTVTISSATTTNNISIGGTLTISGTNTLTVKDLSNTGTIHSPGGTIILSGNWNNTGTYNGSTNGKVVFTGTENTTISGTTNFEEVTIDKGNLNTALSITGNVTVSSGGLLTLTSGLIKIGTGSSLNLQYSNGLTIPATGGFDLTGGTLSTGNFTITNNGLIRVNSGIFNFGTNSGNAIHTQNKGALYVSGGTVNIAGRLTSSASGTLDPPGVASGIHITGGTVTLNTVGQELSNVGSLNVTSAGNFSFTGGTIVFQRPSTAATELDLGLIGGSGTKNTVGGVFQFGNASSPSGPVFQISSDIALHTVNTFAGADLQLTRDLIISGQLNLGTGSHIIPGQYSIQVPVIANGTLTFPFADNSGNNYPVTVTVSGTSYINAWISVSSIGSRHPQNNNSSNVLNRHWLIHTNGISNMQYSVTATYLSTDVKGTLAGFIAGDYAGNWKKITGATVGSGTITVTGLTGNTQLTAVSEPTVTITASDDFICAGSTVTLTAEATGDDINFSWLSTPAGFSGTDNPFSVAPLVNTTFTVTVTDGNGLTASDSKAIAVDPASVGGSIAGGNTVCSGTNSTTLTLSGHVGVVQKWQSSTDNGSNWVDIAHTSTIYTAANLTTTTSYRAIVKSGTCEEAISVIATVNVDPVSAGGSIAGAATVCSGTNSTTLTLSGHVGAVQKWQSSTDNGSNWVDINHTSTTYTAANLTTTTSYRAIVKSGTCEEAISIIATVNVDPVSVGGSIAGAATVCSGTNSILLTLSGYTGSIVRWESTTNGTTWNPVINTNSTYTAANLTQTTTYRAVVKSGECSETFSNDAMITVDPLSVGGTIAGATTVCAGTNSTTLTLSGYTGSIVRWESTTNGTTWNPVINTNATYTAANLTQTTTYRAVVKSGECSETFSNDAMITVDPLSVGGTIAGATTVCAGTNSTTLTLSGYTGSIVRWESSVNGTNWTAITNTNATYTAANLTQTTTYRAVVKSGECSETFSNDAMITVDPVSVGGTIAGATTVCAGTNSTVLTLSGYTGSIVRWESSTDGTNWNPIVNPNSNYTASSLTQSTTYRAVVKSGECSEAVSGTAVITVDPISVGGTIAGAATVCSGINSTTLTLSGHVGAVQKWQSSTDNGSNWVDIAHTSNIYTASNLTATASYRAIVKSGLCSEAVSAVAEIIVNPNPTVNAIPNQTFCNNSSTSEITFSGPITETTYAWTNNNTAIGLAANGSGNIPEFTATNTTNVLISATITVTPTANGCTGPPVTFTITVNPTPTVNAITNRILCNNTPYAGIAFSGPVSGTAYTWTNSNPSIGLQANGFGNIPSFTPTNGTLGTISGTITVTPTANGCVGTPFTFTITVNPTPTASITVDDDIVCRNAPSPLVTFMNPLSLPVIITYRRNNNLANPITVAANGNTTVAVPTDIANTYIYTLGTVAFQSDPTCVIEVPGSVTVTVVPTANVVPLPSVQAICSALPIDPIILTSPTEGVIYNWTRNNADIVTGIESSGTGDVISGTLTNTISSQVTVTFTITPVVNGCNGTSATATVTVNPIPEATVAPATQYRCSGEGISSIVPSSLTPGTTYTWTRDHLTEVTGIGESGTGIVPIVSLINNTSSPVTVTFTFIPTANGCTGDPATATVLVNPKPQIPNLEVTYCNSGPFNVAPVDGENGVVPDGIIYKWSVQAATGGITGQSSGEGPSISGTLNNSTNFIQSVTYSVTPRLGDGCIGEFFLLKVNITPEPAITNMAVPICSDNTFTVSPVNTTNGIVPSGTTYSWSEPTVSGNITGGEAGSGTTITGTLINSGITAGTATYTVVPTAGICGGQPFTVTVTVNPAPAIHAIAQSVCSGDPFTVTPFDGTDGRVPSATTYSWSAPATSGSITGGIAGNGASNISGTLTNTSNIAQTATYTVYPSSGNCAGEPFTVTLTVHPKPAVNPMSDVICSKESFSVTPVNVTNGIVPAGTTYSWAAPGVTGIEGMVAGTNQERISGQLNNTSGIPKDVVYTVTPSAGGCDGIAFTVTVTVNPGPAINPMTATVCSGGMFTITPVNGTNGSVPAGTSYTWPVPNLTAGVTGGEAGSGTGITGTLTNTTTSAQTVVYTVTPVSGTCPTSTFELTVTVNPPPSVSISGNAEVCYGVTTPDITFTNNINLPVRVTYTVNGGADFTVDINGSSSVAVPATINQEGTLIYSLKNVAWQSEPLCSTPASGTATITVKPVTTVVISGTPSGTICYGTPVTFSANVANAGSNPAYQWYVNGNPVLGEIGTTFTSATLNNTDKVKLIVNTSGTPCDGPYTSNEVTMTVNPSIIPMVDIFEWKNQICEGTEVLFETNLVLNGGTNPTYQWYKNGDPVSGATATNYSDSNLEDGDKILLRMISDANCAVNPAESKIITMTVYPNLPVSVSISADANDVCAGTPVTFTATPTNGGGSPHYQWTVNNGNVGTNSNTFTYIPVNNDQVSVILTSSEDCTTGNPAFAAPVTMSVQPNLPVSVNIAPDANPVCDVTTVTFTATPTNGGSNPAYQWKVNGANIGNNSNTYSYTPANNDVITVILTSSEDCTTENPATSAPVTMTVNPNLPVNVSIAADANPVCEGTPVIFTATPTNGGSNPAYQWKVNGAEVGTNSNTYSYAPANNDVITVELISSEACTTGNTAISQPVTMTVNQNLPVSVSISPDDNPVCEGTPVTFTATPTNEGTTPGYQWYVNNSPAGTGGVTYSYTPSHGDVVTVQLTSDATCATGNPATSIPVTMTVNPNLPVSVSIAANANPVCDGTSVNFTATPVNGGANPSFQWYVNRSPVGINPNYTYTPKNGDVVYVVLTSDETCATGNPATSNEMTLQVDQPVTETPQLPEGDVSVCTIAELLNYAVHPVLNATGYIWTLPSGWTIVAGAGTNNISVNVAGVSPGTYYVSVRGTSSCEPGPLSAPLEVSVGLYATADAGSDQTICFTQQNIKINGIAGGAADPKKGTWTSTGTGTFENNKKPETTYTPSAADRAAGTVTLTFTTDIPTGGCGAASDQMILTIRPDLFAAISGATTICSGSSSAITFTANPNTIVTYRINNGTNQTIAVEGTGTADLNTGALSASTTYTLVSVNWASGPGCSKNINGQAVTVNVNPAPTVSAGGPDNVCESSVPSSITLTGASIGAGATTGGWSIVAGGGTLSNYEQTTTPAAVTYTPAADFSGTVTLRLTTNAPEGCSPVSDDRIINVTPAPLVDAGGPDDVCQSSDPIPYTLTGASIGGGATTGAWSVIEGSGTLSSTAQTTTPAAVTFTPEADFSGTVTLRLTTDAPGACSAVFDDRTINVRTAPTVDAGGPDVVCVSAIPSAITLSGAMVDGGAATGAWSVVSGGGSLSSYDQTPTPDAVTYTPDANFSGTVTLRLTTNAPGVCPAVSATRTITIEQEPTADAGGPDVVCQSASPSAITLTGAIVGGGASTGAWSIESGSGTLSNTGFTATPSTVTFTPVANFHGTVILTLTTNAPGNCDAATATRTITVNEAVTVDAGTYDPICQGSTIALAGIISGGATEGRWTGGAGNFNPDRNTPTAIYTPTAAEVAAGSVTLTLTSVDPDGPCGPVSDATTITIHRAVVITTQPVNTGACVGSSASLSVVAVGTNLSYQWYKGTYPDGTFTGETSSTLSFNPVSLTDNGSYYVIVSGESPCNPAISNTVTLNVDAAIAISAQPVNQTRCAGENVTFSVTADAGGNPLTYQWRYKGDDIDGATSSAYMISDITAEDAGSYDVVIGSSAGFSCPSVTSAAATLTVNEEGTISLPGNDDQTVCANDVLDDIIYIIGGSATGATLTGLLPNGVTGSLSGGVFTIAGLPTETGTFEYAITTTGSPCINPSRSGTITVNGVGTISLAGGNANPTLCINTPLQNITYSIGGNATAAIITSGSLPAGVEGVYANGLFTISGAPTAAGVYPFTVSTTGSSCGNPSLSGEITVREDATIEMTGGNDDQSLCLGNPIGTISYTIGGTSTGVVLSGTLPPGVTGNIIGNDYIISGTPSAAGTFNYTVTTTGPCHNNSLSGTIQVDYLPDGGFISPAISTVCTETNSGNLILEGYTGDVIQWEQSLDAGYSWTPIAGTASDTYTFTNLPQTTLFRALVGNENCGQVYSQQSRITIVPSFTPEIVASGGDVCSGEPITLTATAAILPVDVEMIEGGSFNYANPAGWRITDNSGAYIKFPANANNAMQNPWSETNGPKTFCIDKTVDTSDNTKFAIVNGDIKSTMETPVFSLISMSSAELSFKHAYSLSPGAIARVELSMDGGNTYSHLLAEYSGVLMGSVPNVINPIEIDLSAYLGMSNLRIRFYYESTQCDVWAVEGITLPVPEPDVELIWGPSELIPGGTGLEVIVLPPTTTTFTLTMYIAGCPGVATFINIPVIDNPEVTTTNTCVGGTVTFLQSTTYDGTWSISGGGTIDPGSGVFTATTPGCYTAYFTTTSGGCEGSASFVVFPVAPLPDVTEGCGPIEVTPPPAVEGFDVQYSFDDGNEVWGPNFPPTEENCNGYSIKIRYIATAFCEPTTAGTNLVCSESEAVVRRIDKIAPTFNAPPDITINKDADCNYDASPAVTGLVTDVVDNCPTDLVPFYEDRLISGVCEDIIERTWMVEDGCGEPYAQVQRITVRDNTPPVIYPLASDEQSECVTGDPNEDPGYLTWLSNRGGAEATDNCTLDLIWTDNSDTQPWIIISGQNQKTVTWTVADNCGNFVTTEATYTITDDVPPTITCPVSTNPLGSDLFEEFVSGDGCIWAPVNVPDPTFADDCGVVAVTYTLSGATTDSSPEEGFNYVSSAQLSPGITTVTYTAWDAAGNKSVPCSIRVWVKNNTDPQFSLVCPVIDNNVIEVPAGSNLCVADVVVPAPEVTNICLEAYTVAYRIDSQDPVSVPTPSEGENIDPLILRLEVGVHTVTWLITDASENVHTCDITVEVVDDQLPKIFCQDDVEDFLSGDGCYKISDLVVDPDFSDNCPGPELEYLLTFENGSTEDGTGTVTNYPFPIGKTQVTYIVTDASGNVASCSFQVWVKNTLNPQFEVNCLSGDDAYISVPAESGGCDAEVAVPAPEIISVCFEAYTTTYQVNDDPVVSVPYPGEGVPLSVLALRFDVGAHTVTWTITDASGNPPHICIITIEVTDVNSELTCPESLTRGVEEGELFALDVHTGDPSVIFNCADPLLKWELVPPADFAFEYEPSELEGFGIYPTGGTFFLGVTTITYSLTDAKGDVLVNPSGDPIVCSFTVTVVNEPVIECRPSETFNANADCEFPFNPGVPELIYGMQPIIWKWTLAYPDAATIIDEGGSPTTVSPFPSPIVPEAPHIYNFQPGTTTIVWTAEDPFGNIATCIQTITVIDDTPPDFDLPDTYVDCVDMLRSAVYNPFNPNPRVNHVDPNLLKNPSPDYHTFTSGSTELDIQNLRDNCCVREDLIHWRIDFSNTPDPLIEGEWLIHDSIEGTGQPSAYGSDMHFPGDGVLFTEITHTITYWVEDCNGNPSDEQTQEITITPRPKITKMITP
jgi:hypothetical protein